MKNLSNLCVLFFVLTVLLACKAVGGGSSTKPYTNAKDNFTVTFPPESKEVVVRSDDPKDSTYMTNNGNGIYEVRVFEWSRTPNAGDALRDYMVGAGVHFPLDDETKEIQVPGSRAVESYGWATVGTGTRVEERQVSIRPTSGDKVYVVLMKSDKKEKLKTKEADAFFSSFKLGATP